MTLRLAAAIELLQQQMKPARWNVTGPDFLARHDLFDTIAEAQKLHDGDTSGLFTGVSHSTDQWLWFVETHALATP